MARVLVVDDNPLERAVLVSILTSAGYTVAQAGEGADALRLVLEEPPDLVVLDLRLPDAGGEEVAGAIRAVDRTQRMPIVIVTAFQDAAERLDPKRFGASCILTKPVGEEALRGAVERCLTGPVGDDAPER